MRANTFYHVAPRHTAGSPAMVPFVTAERVAKQEMDAYLRAVELDPDVADEKGLDAIAYATVEKGGKVYVTDMITKKSYCVPVNQWSGRHWHSRPDRELFRVRVEAHHG